MATGSDTPDIIATYFPAYTDLTPTQLQNMYARLQAWLALSQPNLDTAPDSVFGNLYLNPAAQYATALEVAVGRILSDMDLANTAAGVTYNCQWVQNFLNNFAIFDTTNLQSTGVVRFIFSADGPYFIDRGALFQINTNNFSLRLANDGGLTVLPVGSTLTAGSNQAVLCQISSTLYAFDWPVIGTMTTAVTAGSTGTTTANLPTLTSITAMADFAQGSGTLSLQEQAKLTRTTFYSASMNGRGPAYRFLTKSFPDITAASPILTGDFEMIRDTVNPLGVKAGYLDACIKSTGFMTGDTVTIPLTYYATQEGSPLAMFIGQLNLTDYPQRINSITYAGDSTINLNPGGNSIKIFSQSTNFVKAPLAAAAYSAYEQLWIAIPMPVDPATGLPLITPDVALDGTQSAQFVISVDTDPLIPGISAFLASNNVAAVNTDTLIKGFVPINIASMNIKYTRAPGTATQLTQAQSSIYEYMLGLGGPNALYSDAQIYDFMFYAGASDVRSIDVSAFVQWSVAGYYMPAGLVTPDQNYAATLAGSVAAKQLTISSSRGLLPQYTDPNIGTDAASYEVIGQRNTTYLLDQANITFTEIR